MLLQQMFCKRFYDQYHSINALKYSNLFFCARMIDGKAVGYLDCSSHYIDSVKILYAIDMHVMLFPGLQNGELIDNMVQALEIKDHNIPNGWLVQDLHKSYINLFKYDIWSSIIRLVEMVAKGSIRENNWAQHAVLPRQLVILNLQPDAQRSDDYLIHFVASALGPTSYSI